MENKRIAFCVAQDINIGAGYVISYLKSQGHEVKLFLDPQQFNRGYARNGLLANFLSIEDYNIKQIKKFNPDICCFSAVTATYKWALRVAEKVKKEVGCKIIFGGVHPTLCPEEVRSHKFIDDVIVGDGIKYFCGVFDPDTIFPDREIFLKELPPEHRKVQIIMAAVGCPFNCSYCGNEQLRSVGEFRMIKRKVDSVIAELKEMKQNGAEYILFVDDILTMNKVWFKDFAVKYKANINLPYGCFIHAKCCDKEIAEYLKLSGCQSAWMGIQTGLEALRKEILNRQETNIEIRDAAVALREQGIKLIVDHIFGIPRESDMSQDISIALLTDIKPDIVNCYEMLYFPKAGIIKHALECGYLKQEDVDKLEKGEGIVYQVGNHGQKYYDKYVKGFVSIPLGGCAFWEFAPIWLIKIFVYIKAKRTFIIKVVLENEIFFTWRAILKKLGVYRG